jgi:hypothetical protein
VDKLGSVDALAGSHHLHYNPPYRARGPYHRAPISTHLDSSSRSRLLAPTKASAAKAINRDPEDIDTDSRTNRSRAPSRSVSRSLSPKKETVSARVSPGKAESPAVATRTRGSTQRGDNPLFSVFPAAPKKPRHAAPSSRKPLRPITTLETAHAPSPRESSFPYAQGVPSSSRKPATEPILSSPLTTMSDTPAFPIPEGPQDPNTQPAAERAIQPGMERGFTLSPMYNLVLEYNQQRDTELSLFM